MQRIILLAVIAALIAAFFLLDINQWLTLEGLQTGLARFEEWRSSAPLLVAGGFFLLYVAVTALSLPGAAVMTLAGGALFGLGWGLLIVSFASSIGATLAFLVSRYLFRDTVQARFGERLKALNAGIERDGAFYLFTLRLVPVFPFFVINLLMGLTPIRAITFYWVSQVGMLAGTVVYVNAGTQLAQLESLGDVLSPTLIGSFALLGVFPLLARKIVGFIQGRRIYKRWQKPKQFDRNLVVIGAGAGGLVSAYIGATVKAGVTLVEAHKMGGDCLNYGCIPSKTLIKTAKLANRIRHADQYGLSTGTLDINFRAAMGRVQEVISAIEPHDSVERYTDLGVDVVQGYATIVDPWTVEIAYPDGSRKNMTTRNIIIAAGARPFVPPLPGIEDSGYVTSDTLWSSWAELDAPPARLIVLGGGPIGCELAQCFARLGSRVSLVEMLPRLLLKEDEEVSAIAQAALQKDGIEVYTNSKALRCEYETEDGQRHKYLVIEGPAGEQRLPFDGLLCAVGRAARLEGYGLENLGIDTNRTIITNDFLQTTYPNIYAVGDVAGPYQFTHTAAHQAWYAAVNALFGEFKMFRADYRVIPWVTFLEPEIARVGVNEQEATEQGLDFEVTRYELDDLDRAIAEGERQGFVKVLTAAGKDRILGVTLVGEHSGELLAEFVLAMKHGLGLNKILGTIHSYPTRAEANKYAAGEWKRKHAPQRILALLKRYHAWRRG
ncbi:pyridine nucleotide-disulfide oxidoreductase [Kineobactrum sediminis]|uniref:Pyridine nucleotide-disulfide oxidoreductase n=1 Tax=Kineobactrum sediminis TaxID=1905677 RepID=A0A2N5XXU1_9GAMM|nr:bifunctional TVP38/TMEM64 family protein/FAD-dependent oxidoreductase [Kineobactrum sediminis]PLW80974.1 pyridine nucleotide-disulfide oxidoreductase [Kineobactrum sediminis]